MRVQLNILVTRIVTDNKRLREKQVNKQVTGPYRMKRSCMDKYFQIEAAWPTIMSSGILESLCVDLERTVRIGYNCWH